TGAAGTLTGQLPIGNYSVYGLVLNGSTWSAGVSTAAVTAGSVSLAPLLIAPAGRIHGTIATQGGATGTVVQVLAYDRSGNVAWTFTNNTGAWGLSLPYGTYSLLAVQSPVTDQPAAYAQVGSTTIAGVSTTVTLSLNPAVLFRPLVGAASVSAGPVSAVSGVKVQLSVEHEGILFTGASNNSGNITYYLPAAFANGGSYCVNATSPGFLAYSDCGLSASDLQSLSTVGLTANRSSFTLTLGGLPSSGHATVNVTSLANSGNTAVLHGQGVLTATLSPGTYALTGWAPAPSGSTGLYQQSSTVTISVPVGSFSTAARLDFVHVVRANATLKLPVGMPAANATIELHSPTYNASVSGSSFTTHFLVPPGSYTVLANALGRGGSFSALTTLTFNATGVANQPLTVTGPGTTLSLNLSVPGSTLSNGSLTGRLVASNGLGIPAAFNHGRFVGGVPSGLSYTAQVTGAELVAGPDGTSYYANLSVAPSQAPCTAVGPSTACTVNLTAIAQISGISGSLGLSGFPGVVPGTLEIVGPGGTTTPRYVDASSGTF
ncbi:MAG: hypothetical protein ACHQ16_06610, partial [Candidatus Lutacidiplasmatales archaeon]